jgi:hypothetical protein
MLWGVAMLRVRVGWQVWAWELVRQHPTPQQLSGHSCTFAAAWLATPRGHIHTHPDNCCCYVSLSMLLLLLLLLLLMASNPRYGLLHHTVSTRLWEQQCGVLMGCMCVWCGCVCVERKYSAGKNEWCHCLQPCSVDPNSSQSSPASCALTWGVRPCEASSSSSLTLCLQRVHVTAFVADTCCCRAAAAVLLLLQVLLSRRCRLQQWLSVAAGGGVGLGWGGAQGGQGMGLCGGCLSFLRCWGWLPLWSEQGAEGVVVFAGWLLVWQLCKMML